MQNAADAHRDLEARKTTGSTVLIPNRVHAADAGTPKLIGRGSVLERAQGVAAERRERTGGLYSLGGVVLAVALYSLCHITARLIASGNLGEDDPLDAILTQTLALGYLPGQPPLYDWALWLIEQVTGPGALPFQLLKYGLLTATCGFMFLSARRVMKGDAFWAFLSVESLALIYQISWRFHEGFTHAVGAMCAVAATFWAVLRLIERGRPADFALFGLCVGLGGLTVRTFWIYAAALIGAACLQPAMRRVLLQPRAGIALAMAALVEAPYLIWLSGTPEGLAAMLPAFAADNLSQYIHLALAGVRRAFTEPLMYLSPLIFLYPLFFPGWLPTVRRRVHLRPDVTAQPDSEQLILHLTLISVGALIAAAVLFGIQRYPVHALMPMFLLTSIWLTAQARNAAPDARQIRRFIIMAASVAVFAFCARAANMYVLEPVCSICRWGVPYAALAEEMKRLGFEPGRIIVSETELGGNLRRFFPKARIELVGETPYAPPAPDIGPAAKTVLIWSAERDPGDAAARFQSLAPFAPGQDPANAAEISIPWRRHFWKPDGYRVSAWRLLAISGAPERAASQNIKHPPVETTAVILRR